MYCSTGLTRDQIDELYDRIRTAHPSIESRQGRTPIMDLADSVTVALMYLRRNHVQHELAEWFGASQPTISRVVNRFVAVIADVLEEYVPTAEDLHDGEQLLVDGTLAPCWSWKTRPDLWSGKHHCTGHNIQIAADLHGRLNWIGDPHPGSMHDSRALRESGFLDDEHPTAHVADKGYIGLGLICPVRKPAHRELDPTEKAFNKQVNSIRAAVERAIAHLKTWRILHTDYRRPLHKFAETLTAIIALEFYRTRPF